MDISPKGETEGKRDSSGELRQTPITIIQLRLNFPPPRHSNSFSLSSLLLFYSVNMATLKSGDTFPSDVVFKSVIFPYAQRTTLILAQVHSLVRGK